MDSTDSTFLERNGGAGVLAIAGGGLGLFLSADPTDDNKIAIFRDQWWVKGLATLIAGWYLWRRGNKLAPVVLLLGGYWFAQGWREEQARRKKAT
jgi:hypothetical protein